MRAANSQKAVTSLSGSREHPGTQARLRGGPPSPSSPEALVGTGAPLRAIPIEPEKGDSPKNRVRSLAGRGQASRTGGPSVISGPTIRTANSHSREED